MIKNISLVSAGVMSLGIMAFGYAEWNNSKSSCAPIEENFKKTAFNYYFPSESDDVNYTEFFYDFGPRFNMTISKSKLQEALTVADILPADDIKNIEKYKSVNLVILKNDEQTDMRAKGYSEKFTEAQLKLFRSMDYSTNFLLRTDFESNSHKTREGFNYITPHMTVVPEKQAEYKEGKEFFLNYISAINKKNTLNLDKTKLQPAKLYFTITKTGAVDKINIDRGCGFSFIDINMIEIITKSSGKWIPAENEKGEKVDQELVLSYGMIGC
jgi:hypothetical protein